MDNNQKLLSGLFFCGQGFSSLQTIGLTIEY